MGKLPALSSRELLSALERMGFVVIRLKGSHQFLRHPDGRTTVVASHAGASVGPGLLMKILKDCEITRDELIANL